MARLEHIGIAVDNVDAAVNCFRDLLGEEPYKQETGAEQQVRTHVLDVDTAKLELLEALGDDSTVQRFVDRQGEGLHHLAFEVPDLSATMRRLRERGFELLSDAPQEGTDDEQIAFVHPRQTHGVLVGFGESVAPSWSALDVPRHDGHLAVFERGPRTRPTLLVLHGAAGSTRSETAPLMHRLESSFHLVGVDLSGHGTSAFPSDRDFSLDLFAEDVRVALEALNLSSAHVFGFSLGGGVALHLAQRSPALVDRLAVFQTNVDWTRPQAERMWQRLDLDALKDNAPKQAEHLQARHDSTPHLLEQLRGFVETLPDASEELAQGLSELSTPTLVGAVDRDPLFGPEAPQALYQMLPDARLAILPGEHHNLAKAPLPLLSSLLQQHFSAE